MLSGVNGAIDHVQIKHESGTISTLYFKSYKQGREKFQGARCHLIHLDDVQYQLYCDGAFQCAASYIDNSKTEEDYPTLFSCR